LLQYVAEFVSGLETFEVKIYRECNHRFILHKLHSEKLRFSYWLT